MASRAALRRTGRHVSNSVGARPCMPPRCANPMPGKVSAGIFFMGLAAPLAHGAPLSTGPAAVTAVFGHKIPDTDAICAAMVYAWELESRGALLVLRGRDSRCSYCLAGPFSPRPWPPPAGSLTSHFDPRPTQESGPSRSGSGTSTARPSTCSRWASSITCRLLLLRPSRKILWPALPDRAAAQ